MSFFCFFLFFSGQYSNRIEKSFKQIVIGNNVNNSKVEKFRFSSRFISPNDTINYYFFDKLQKIEILTDERITLDEDFYEKKIGQAFILKLDYKNFKIAKEANKAIMDYTKFPRGYQLNLVKIGCFVILPKKCKYIYFISFNFLDFNDKKVELLMYIKQNENRFESVFMISGGQKILK